jgi:hypothetical protein
MKLYAFDVVLKDISEVTDDLANRLFTAGCEDSTPSSCNGVAWVHFDREADSLEEAIRSAVEQVQRAGLRVAKVEVEVEAVSGASA